MEKKANRSFFFLYLWLFRFNVLTQSKLIFENELVSNNFKIYHCMSDEIKFLSDYEKL